MNKPTDQERVVQQLEEAYAEDGSLDFIRDAAILLRASLQPAGVEVPDGYALVPIEPGIELLTEMSRALGMHPLGDGSDGSYPITGAQSTVMQCYRAMLAAAPHPVSGEKKVERLSVWEGSMPESNGKTNYTAILHNGDISEGMTIARSEYPDRVRFEADMVRWLIGDLAERPFILEYDANKHSAYVPPPNPAIESGLIDITDRIPSPYTVGRCPLCGDDIHTDASVTLVKALERQGLAHSACVK